MPVWTITRNMEVKGLLDSPIHAPIGIPMAELRRTAVPETWSDNQKMDQNGASGIYNHIERKQNQDEASVYSLQSAICGF